MKTLTSTKTVKSNEFNQLRQEVSALRSFVISMVGKDKEGNYRPAAVREIIEASLEPATHRYSGKGSLLKHLKKV